MNGHSLQTSLEELVSGDHERCAWCKKPLSINQDGSLAYFKGSDGMRYCTEEHGSPPYLTRRRAQL
jgi:hypothetical protein